MITMILRYPIWILGAMLLGLVGLACAAPKGNMVQDYTPNFHYEYTKGEAPATDVTMALVKPSYQAVQSQPVAINPFLGPQPQSNEPYQHLQSFRQAMAVQLEEMLSEKGVRVTGPYDDLDSMTFPDKKGADLALIPVIAVTLHKPTVSDSQKMTPVTSWTSTTVYSASGDCTVSGFVSFVIIEPLSAEKVWIKKVDMPSIKEDCSGSEMASPSFTDNGAGKVLEKAYQSAMDVAWKYLSPEELTLLKKKAQELREKKVY